MCCGRTGGASFRVELPSAAAMGEACEHFLYDKGYGPTNLTLKHYLTSIFGRGMPGEEGSEARAHEPTLIPLQDEMRTIAVDDGGPTRVVSPLKKVIVRASTPRPGSQRKSRVVVRAPTPKPGAVRGPKPPRQG